MDNKKGLIMENLELVFKENFENKVDIMMLYSIVEKNKKSVDEILNLEDNDVLEIKVKELKDFFTDYKILSAILEQSIATQITPNEQIEIKNNLNLDFEDISKTENQPRISHLMSYNYYLEKNDGLIDTNMEKFLCFLENGDGDSSAIAFEELSEQQKISVPKNLQSWIAKNTIYN